MQVTIKSLSMNAYNLISEALGSGWFEVFSGFYLNMCDVILNIDIVKLQPDVDGVWLFVGERVYKLESEDFLEIVIE